MSEKQSAMRVAFTGAYDMTRNMRDELRPNGAMLEWISDVEACLRDMPFAAWQDAMCKDLLKELLYACYSDGYPLPFDPRVLN